MQVDNHFVIIEKYVMVKRNPLTYTQLPSRLFHLQRRWIMLKTTMKVDSKQDSSPTRQVKSIKALKDLSEQEKTLVDKFNQLLQEMEASGKDNGEELCVILNKLRNTGILDEESSQTLFNAMEDVYNKSSDDIEKI